MKKNIVLLEKLSLFVALGWAGWRWGRQQKLRLESEVLIDAPPEIVWQVLTDTAAYPQWNPVIVRLSGKMQAGNTIEFENRGSHGHSLTFRPVILKVKAARELRWLGRLWLAGLFDGEHYFMLTPRPGNKTHLEHGEHFSGLLLPLTRRWLKTSVQEDFTRINAALKSRAEQVKERQEK